VHERLVAEPASSRRRTGLLLLLAVLTFLVFSRAITASFVTWDDEPLIYANPNIVIPTCASLRWHWTHPHIKLYIPLIYTAWWAVARLEQSRSGNLGQLSPFGFHLANVAVHMTSVCIVFILLRRLLKRNWPAAAGAALFAVHPLQVEAVAWATGMKDLLGGLLTLAALTAYVAAATDSQARHPRRAATNWILATSFFLLALLAKPSAVVTPLLAGVIDLLLLRRTWRQIIPWLAPWALLSAAWIVITIHIQPATAVYAGPLWSRPLIAADALAFYLQKLLCPVNLAIDYGRTPAAVLAHASIYWRWLIPALIAALVWHSRNLKLQTATLLFLFALLPVLGFVRFEFQSISTVADRYAYVAMLGPALAFATATKHAKRKLPTAIVATIPLICATISWIQIPIWHNSESLYEHTIAVNPQSLTATHDLAVVYDKAGRSEEAINLYLRVLKISPSDPEWWDDLAGALFRADERRPDLAAHWAALHQKLATNYANHGRPADAEEQQKLTTRDRRLIAP
jgi:protein O-mannosyl-transferase